MAATHTFTFRWVDGFGSARAACHRVNEDISTVKELIQDANILWANSFVFNASVDGDTSQLVCVNWFAAKIKAKSN